MRGCYNNEKSIMKKHPIKGFTLIIVVFAMMLFGILGWTLALMQSADFQQNERNLDSERALFLADSGAQWALKELSLSLSWRTDSAHGYSNGYAQHDLAAGQYRVICRDPQGTEQGSAVIESTGYVPFQLNYNAMRSVKLTVTAGGFNNVLQAHTYFNWSAIHAGSTIDGQIQSPSYEGDGDSIHNEPGVDYSDNPLLPPGGPVNNSRIVAAEPYPLINMVYFQAAAGARVWDLARVSTIAAIGPGTRIRVSGNIFTTPATQWENVTAIRNVTRGTWDNQNWRVITQRISDNTVGLESAVTWAVGDQVKVVKLFAENHNSENLWYIKGDVLFDLRTKDISFKNTVAVIEGDIVIKGTSGISFDGKPDIYPSLATQTGNILSTDTPGGTSESNIRMKRQFGNFVYTQTGNVNFNYMDGSALMGNNVILDGQVRFKYDKKNVLLVGVGGGISEIKWNEQ